MNTDPKIIFDARIDLSKGIHPVEKVLAELDSLEAGKRYLLITLFPPVPLIAKAKEKGFQSEEKKIDDSEYHTYFFR